MSSSSRNVIVVALLVFLGAGFWWFAQSQKNKLPAPSTVESPVTTPTQTLTATSEAEVMEASEITVEGSEFKFTPPVISLKAGEKVKLTFKNTGKLLHNLTINELGVATKTVSGGESDTIEFTANKTGSFTMYCSIGNHRAQGLEGDVEIK